MSPRYLRQPTAKSDVYDITIEGVIGEDIGASDVRKALAKAPKGATLMVHLNSEGGVVTEGMAIHSMLKAYKGRKICIVEGLAASIASVVMCACDEIRVAKGAFTMIHQASAGVEGGADDMEQMASTLRKMNAEIVDIYSARTGKDPDELAKLIDRRDHYMTAEETVALGLADKVATAQASIAARAVARLTNPPESLRAHIKGKAMDEEEAKALKDKCAELEAENKALKAKAAKAKAEESDEDEDEKEEEARAEEEGEEPAHDEEDEDEDEDEKEEAKAIVALASQLTGKKSHAEIQAALAVRISTAGKEAPAARATEVSEAIRSGKLPPALKQWALKASAKAWSSYRASMKGKQVVPVGRSFTAPSDKHDPGDKPLGGGGSPGSLTAAERKYMKATGKTEAEILALRGVKVVYGSLKKDEE